MPTLRFPLTSIGLLAVVVLGLSSCASDSSSTSSTSTPTFTTGGVPAISATSVAAIKRGMQGLVAAKGGPIGMITTLRRDGRTAVISVGRSDVTQPGAPRATDHMRIASIAKAFSGAVALRLAQDGKLSLDDTIGQRLPGLPKAWHGVTIGQMLNHTSGLSDYTKSAGFAKHARTDPQAFITPNGIIDWVRKDGLMFPSGSKYEYSNTDNIVVGLIAEAVTKQPYPALLASYVFGPAKLDQTTFPTKRISLPTPFIHGYGVVPGARPQDLTTFLSPSGAWASGAIVSTPANLNAFIGNLLDGTFFGVAERKQQMTFVAGGRSSPPGPGKNSAGLALFRYETRCGTLYGHTGNFPGYVQWAAANADGSRSVTTSANIAAPTGRLLAQLRAVQGAAACALLGK